MNATNSLQAKISAEGIFEISPEQALEATQNNSASRPFVIDVRRPDEFNAELGHVADAQLVTLETEFMKWLEHADPKKVYIFSCRSGARSARATAIARTKGFEAYNLEGGMILWNSRQLPVVRT